VTGTIATGAFLSGSPLAGVVGPALLALLMAYLSLGFLVALAFLLVGLDRIDAAARGSFLFRPLLMPGLVLLWPLVLMRWVGRARALP